MVKAVLLERLWTRMNERGDFPLLSQSLRATVAAMGNDDLDFGALVQVVLSDFALTQKVLRLANSAMYMAFGGNITTVTRALMVLGMDAVGHLVVGLKIVDHFHQSAPRRIDAKLELNRTMLSGFVARKLTEGGDVRAGEEAVVCTLMRQVGKLLVVFYLDSEWDEIRVHLELGATEDEACNQVLGVTYDELGREAATRWRLPDTIRTGMSRYDPADDDGQPQQWLRAITNYSTEVAKVLTSPELTDDARAAQVADLARGYSRVLATDADALVQMSLAIAREEADDGVMREIVELHADADAIARSERLDPEARIAAGIADLRALPSDSPFSTALTLVSETVLASLGFARTIVFVRRGSNVFEARLGFGPGVDDAMPNLTFNAAFQPDVFHLAIANSVGIFIENARDPKMIARQPAWFRASFSDVRAFVLLPSVPQRGAPIALVYGDWLTSQEPRRISQREMSALNELARELARFFSPASIEAA
ncbi:HDOD domain-containing protein [Paraburkholderia caballeronis]|uniref:HDOD domain-containing protein n=1 Tax=Paraburkholderia caballeronis TaxID=416943 RepID=A0A1H7K533_9BURK|nr:HDOD domain-containing protein [Paraburkholderia caballeronis]PXW27115.1 HDOD domain-containing protein [Paraburkholderia caballeronis]PXX02589.1 HDOD domain-containing protein [Paraburkholderia caballeronis]RAK03314.1 HDOD domain-containing protein [Paraburkholderia caballeronis]TDV11628.1 HDOD domain-containing protein [Paraburkholderia caballeronis]TDV17365.1 HDOD domain-containing protein [Paraburkholderia caballeronis]